MSISQFVDAIYSPIKHPLVQHLRLVNLYLNVRVEEWVDVAAILSTLIRLAFGAMDLASWR